MSGTIATGASGSRAGGVHDDERLLVGVRAVRVPPGAVDAPARRTGWPTARRRRARPRWRGSIASNGRRTARRVPGTAGGRARGVSAAPASPAGAGGQGASRSVGAAVIGPRIAPVARATVAATREAAACRPASRRPASLVNPRVERSGERRAGGPQVRAGQLGPFDRRSEPGHDLARLDGPHARRRHVGDLEGGDGQSDRVQHGHPVGILDGMGRSSQRSRPRRSRRRKRPTQHRVRGVPRHPTGRGPPGQRPRVRFVKRVRCASSRTVSDDPGRAEEVRHEVGPGVDAEGAPPARSVVPGTGPSGTGRLYQPAGCRAAPRIGQGTRQWAGRAGPARPARPQRASPPQLGAASHRRHAPAWRSGREEPHVGRCPRRPAGGRPPSHPDEQAPRRGLLVALLAALLAVGSLAAAPAPASAAGIKVAIVVGPAGSLTSSYLRSARGYAAQARSYGATVVEVYTPNATWSRVRSAVQGANLLIYLGHGNGFPNPYNSTLTPLKVDGFGLNPYAGQRQHAHDLLRRVLRPDPGQARAQRGGDPQPPLLLDRELRAGQPDPDRVGGPQARRQLRRRASCGPARRPSSRPSARRRYLIDSLFTSDQAMLDIFWSAPDRTWTYRTSFASVRTPGHDRRDGPARSPASTTAAWWATSR